MTAAIAVAGSLRMVISILCLSLVVPAAQSLFQVV
jgi:hypothetical protein